MKVHEYRAYDPTMNDFTPMFVGLTPQGDYTFLRENGGMFGSSTVDIPASSSRCTVQEFTGCFDVNGTKIFEGDIVEDATVDDKWVVTWDEEDLGWGSAPKYGKYRLSKSLEKSLKVIGNVLTTKEEA